MPRAQAPDAYPEHGKVKFDDQELVHGFMGFLRIQGITDLTWQEVHDLILAWRGVNKAAYMAEAEHMKKMYPSLWKKYGLLNDEKTAPKLRVTRKPEPEPEPQAPAPVGDGLDFLLARIRGK